MKVVIKLLIVALIANGTWRVGQAYMSHYKFIDAVKSLTQHRAEMSDAQVRSRVLEVAEQYSIPVSEEALTVTQEKEHRRTTVTGSYTRPIAVVPGFTYEWPFSIRTETFIIEPQKLDGRQ